LSPADEGKKKARREKKPTSNAPTTSSTLCPPSQAPLPPLPCGTGGAPYAHATNDTSLLASAGEEESGRRDLAESGRTSVVTATGHETRNVRSLLLEEEGEGAGAETVSPAFFFHGLFSNSLKG